MASIHYTKVHLADTSLLSSPSIYIHSQQCSSHNLPSFLHLQKHIHIHTRTINVLHGARMQVHQTHAHSNCNKTCSYSDYCLVRFALAAAMTDLHHKSLVLGKAAPSCCLNGPFPCSEQQKEQVVMHKLQHSSL